MRFPKRKNALQDFIEAVRPELRALDTPEPSDALKARILASSEAGVPMILPEFPQPATTSRRTIIGLAIAVALVVTLIPIQLQRSSAPSNAAEFASPGFFGQAAQAQERRSDGRIRIGPARATAASRMHPLSVTYSKTVHDTAGGLVSTSEIALDLRRQSLDGVAAWRLAWVETVQMHTQMPRWIHGDTAYVAAGDLRLLRRDIHVAPYSRYGRINVHQRFAHDSVSGRMFTEAPSIGAGRTFNRLLAPERGPYLMESLAPVFLMAVPLNLDWIGSASLLGWAVRDDDIAVPIELAVVAEENITTPAGRFDCWRLSLGLPGRRVDYWVRKSDGLGVRVSSRDQRTHGLRELVLTRENR